MIIAIDGPAAAGKSTLARALARALGLSFLDTGAMYRGITWKVLSEGADPRDTRVCERIALETELGFDAHGRVLVDGLEGEPYVRSAEVSLAVSDVSAHRGVREAVVPQQRRIALEAKRGIVAEGRDTTTVVFPDADYKFYLSASIAERARRRALEEAADDRRRAALEREIEERDRKDSSRLHSPLRRAVDAVVIDTDGLDADAVLQRILAYVRANPRPAAGARTRP